MNEPIDPRLDQITDALYRVSVKLLIVRDGTLLTVQEPQGWYGIPGGGINHGQDLYEGLLRELDEELGITSVTPETISPLPSIVSNAGVIDGIPRLTLFYTTHQEVQPSNNELSFYWASAEDLRSLTLAPNIAPIREQLIDHLE